MSGAPRPRPSAHDPAPAIISGMLSFNTPHGQFNYRVAAVILRDASTLSRASGDGTAARAEVLLQVIGDQPYWCLPGGRVDTLEMEASLYYLAALPRDCPETAATSPWKTVETDGIPLLNQWHPIDTLESVNLVPSFLRTRLCSLPDTLDYILHRDE